MKKSIYYISAFSIVIAVLILFAAVITYNTSAAPEANEPEAKSKQVRLFNEAIKNGKPVLAGFYSPT